MKHAVLKDFVFDWALCFHLCEVNCFQNLVGLESPIKHTLRNDLQKGDLGYKYSRGVHRSFYLPEKLFG